MAALDPRIKDSFMKAVAAHLATVGSNNWTPILETHPEISVPTKWRLIRDAKAA